MKKEIKLDNALISKEIMREIKQRGLKNTKAQDVEAILNNLTTFLRANSRSNTKIKNGTAVRVKSLFNTYHLEDKTPDQIDSLKELFMNKHHTVRERIHDCVILEQVEQPFNINDIEFYNKY